MTITSGRDLTKLNEGCRLVAYDDATGLPIPAGARPRGTMTIGWGHTGPEVIPGLVWAQDKADDVFDLDYANAQRAAGRDLGLDDWSRLDVCRQAVLTDMAFELGAVGLRGFGHMLEFIRRGNWVMAAQALQASKLFREVPARERRNVALLIGGTWSAVNAPAPPVTPPPLPEPHAKATSEPPAPSVGLWQRIRELCGWGRE